MVGLISWLSLDSPTAGRARETQPAIATPDTGRTANHAPEAPLALAPDSPTRDIPPGLGGQAAASVAPMDGPTTPTVMPPGGSMTTRSVEEIVASAVDAVVQIETPTGRGTGFFVAPDTLLTNVHVVGNSSSVTIKRASGQTTTARVARTAPAFDVAVLRVSSADWSTAILPMGSALERPCGPGRHRDRLRARHAPEHRYARHRQRGAAIRPDDAGADRRGDQSRKQRRTAHRPPGAARSESRRWATSIARDSASRWPSTTHAACSTARSQIRRAWPPVSPLASSASGDFGQLSPAVGSDTDRARAEAPGCTTRRCASGRGSRGTRRLLAALPPGLQPDEPEPRLARLVPRARRSAADRTQPRPHAEQWLADIRDRASGHRTGGPGGRRGRATGRRLPGRATRQPTPPSARPPGWDR